MELEFIKWLSEHFSFQTEDGFGIGDDAAVLSLPGKTVLTCDTLLDGSHFRLAETAPRAIGHKALAVNLSDLAAMGSRPCGALLSLALPRSTSSEQLVLAQQLCLGMRPLLEEFQVRLVGGDTNVWDGPLAISVTAYGEIASGQPPWMRTGAEVGDVVLATGEFGGSLNGKHLSFTPRVREAELVRTLCNVHAATDVSDGLSLDASHIATDSNVGLVLQLDQIPVAATVATQWPAESSKQIQAALSDGEDFELLVVVTVQDAERLLSHPDLALTQVGYIIEERGLWQKTADQVAQPLKPQGYVHE